MVVGGWWTLQADSGISALTGPFPRLLWCGLVRAGSGIQYGGGSDGVPTSTTLSSLGSLAFSPFLWEAFLS